jgi:2-polyprenyl-6-hydroxyphenyl methylase/3-demethylubiquinone-9 3-methyltransferase
MGIGTYVRHRLGRLEIPAANLYRSVFINLRMLARQIGAITTPRGSSRSGAATAASPTS